MRSSPFILSREERLLEVLFILTFGLITLGPLLVLGKEAISSTGAEWWKLVFPLGRRLHLLVKSLAYAGMVAVGGMILGSIIASYLWSHKGTCSSFLRTFLLFMLPVPGFIHAAGWRSLFRQISDVFPSWKSALLSGQGWTVAWWITIMSLLPVAVGLAWLGFRAVDDELVEAARVFNPDIKVFTDVVLPLSSPFLVAGTGILFVLTLLDYSIPSLCQVNVYALEIFAEFSASGEPGCAFLLAFPLLIINAALLFGAMKVLRKAALAQTGRVKIKDHTLRWPYWFKSIQIIGISLVVMQFLVPIITLSGDTGPPDNILNAIYSSGSEIVFTAEAAIGASIISVLLAYFVAKALSDGYTGGWLWPLVLLPLVLPAPLVGIALLTEMQVLVPGVYGSTAMISLAGAARFAPLAVILIWGSLIRVDCTLIEAGRVMQSRKWQSLLCVEIPLARPALIAGVILVFVLTFGELGATIMVAPPGKSTLTLKLYNYLHYGAAGSVAGLCLATAIFTMLMGGTAFWVLNRAVRPKKKRGGS